MPVGKGKRDGFEESEGSEGRREGIAEASSGREVFAGLMESRRAEVRLVMRVRDELLGETHSLLDSEVHRRRVWWTLKMWLLGVFDGYIGPIATAMGLSTFAMTLSLLLMLRQSRVSGLCLKFRRWITCCRSKLPAGHALDALRTNIQHYQLHYRLVLSYTLLLIVKAVCIVLYFGCRSSQSKEMSTF